MGSSGGRTAAATVQAGTVTGFIAGLVPRQASATTVNVTPGTARDSADATDINLAAETTADITTGHAAGDGLAQVNGLDEKGLDNLAAGSITCSQATTTITASADITSHLNLRAGAGTITTSGAAATGTNTEFLSELAVGDLIGNDSNGWARVTAVSSDTSATLAAALPGGDIGAGAAYTIAENATVQPNNAAQDRIDTLSAAGTAIVVATSATHGAGSPLTLGVEVADLWVAVWVISDGTTPATLLSTQRTTPLALPSGYTAYRRIGWMRNNSSGTFWVLNYLGDGTARRAEYEEGQNFPGSEVIAGGSSASWVNLSLQALCPPTAIRAVLMAEMGMSSAGENFVSLRERDVGAVSTTRNRAWKTASDGSYEDITGAVGECPCNGAQYVQYAVDNATGAGAHVRIQGYVDQL